MPTIVDGHFRTGDSLNPILTVRCLAGELPGFQLGEPRAPLPPVETLQLLHLAIFKTTFKVSGFTKARDSLQPSTSKFLAPQLLSLRVSGAPQPKGFWSQGWPSEVRVLITDAY